MKFKIDEDLPIEMAEILRRQGHDATTATEEGMAGAPDQRIAQVCAREQRIIMTLDLDFGDVRAYPPSEYAGIIVLRLESQDKRRLLALLERMAPLISRFGLVRQLWIVEEDRIRIRTGESEQADSD